MYLKLDKYDVIIGKCNSKKLLFWGAGKNARWQCDDCIGLENYITAIIDNDNNKIGKNFEIKKCSIPVISLIEAIEMYGSNIILILTLKDYKSVITQLNYINNFNNVECYISEKLRHFNEEYNIHSIVAPNLKFSNQNNIPRIIHYFWVGGSEIPDKNKKCIESWKKLCPDYEIKEWNEHNYDLTQNNYMYQAYQNRKWGFVPDYARLDIIYNNGGIYLDTDVEIVKNIDELLNNEAFIGWESRYFVNAGSGFGAVRHNKIIAEMKEVYNNLQFIKHDGTLNLVASPKFQTDVLIKHGLVKDGTYQLLDGISVYPANYFSPKSFYTGLNWYNNNTYTIHHYDATWVKGTEHEETIQLHEEYNQMKDGMKIELPKVGMEDLISVIVPVYNVSNYLSQCIESILSQTYKNLEIILVDDGSDDGSEIICDEYGEKYQNIKVIHKKNGGLVSARKTGILEAKGTYVMSVDSDDWIDQLMVEYLYIRLKDSDADCVVSNMMLEFEESGEQKAMVCSINPGIYELYNDDNIVYRQFFVDDDGLGILHGICGKMYKIEGYREYQLKVTDTLARGEDAACMYPYYIHAQKILISDGNFYHYRKRSESMLHKKTCNLLANWETLYYFLKNNCKLENEEINNIVITNLEKFILRRINLVIGDEFNKSIFEQKNIGVSNYKIYNFPFRRIKKNKRVILFGAGNVGKSYVRQIKVSSFCYLVAWCDSNNYGSVIDGYEVGSAEKIQSYVYDYVIISVLKEDKAKEIKRILLDLGVQKKKIIWEKPQVI